MVVNYESPETVKHVKLRDIRVNCVVLNAKAVLNPISEILL